MLGLDDEIVKNRLQTDFITYVLLPLWDTMVKLFPLMKIHLDTLKKNRTLYTEKMEKITKEREKGERQADV